MVALDAETDDAVLALSAAFKGGWGASFLLVLDVASFEKWSEPVCDIRTPSDFSGNISGHDTVHIRVPFW